MNKIYKLKIIIKSEAIFTNGETGGNIVNAKALTDEYGFVYYHAKTLKGQLKRQGYWLLKQYKNMENCEERKIQFTKNLAKIFGMNIEEQEMYEINKTVSLNEAGIMRLSNLTLGEDIRNYFIEIQNKDEKEDYYKITAHDLIEAQTNIRTGIQVENGVAANKMMTTYHTVKNGLIFYSILEFVEDPKEYLNDLYRIIKSIRYLGAGTHRGRGEIEAELLVNNHPYEFTKEV